LLKYCYYIYCYYLVWTHYTYPFTFTRWWILFTHCITVDGDYSWHLLCSCCAAFLLYGCCGFTPVIDVILRYIYVAPRCYCACTFDCYWCTFTLPLFTLFPQFYLVMPYVDCNFGCTVIGSYCCHCHGQHYLVIVTIAFVTNLDLLRSILTPLLWLDPLLLIWVVITLLLCRPVVDFNVGYYYLITWPYCYYIVLHWHLGLLQYLPDITLLIPHCVGQTYLYYYTFITDCVTFVLLYCDLTVIGYIVVDGVLWPSDCQLTIWPYTTDDFLYPQLHHGTLLITWTLYILIGPHCIVPPCDPPLPREATVPLGLWWTPIIIII